MENVFYVTNEGHLSHHGILGMKWGVRRFQPYPSGQRVKGGKEVGQATKVKQRTSIKQKANTAVAKTALAVADAYLVGDKNWNNLRKNPEINRLMNEREKKAKEVTKKNNSNKSSTVKYGMKTDSQARKNAMKEVEKETDDLWKRKKYAREYLNSATKQDPKNGKIINEYIKWNNSVKDVNKAAKDIINKAKKSGQITAEDLDKLVTLYGVMKIQDDY